MLFLIRVQLVYCDAYLNEWSRLIKHGRRFWTQQNQILGQLSSTMNKPIAFS